MQITITGHQLDITEALREYINGKFAKLERHFDKITSIRVTLGVEKVKQKIDATLLIAGGEIINNGYVMALFDQYSSANAAYIARATCDEKLHGLYLHAHCVRQIVGKHDASAFRCRQCNRAAVIERLLAGSF